MGALRLFPILVAVLLMLCPASNASASILRLEVDGQFACDESFLATTGCKAFSEYFGFDYHEMVDSYGLVRGSSFGDFSTLFTFDISAVGECSNYSYCDYTPVLGSMVVSAGDVVWQYDSFHLFLRRFGFGDAFWCPSAAAEEIIIGTGGFHTDPTFSLTNCGASSGYILQDHSIEALSTASLVDFGYNRWYPEDYEISRTGWNAYVFASSIRVVAEPASLALFGVAVAGLAVTRRRRLRV